MNLLSVHEAQERILSHFKPVEAETLPLTVCAGRVLATDIISSDLPLFDNSLFRIAMGNAVPAVKAASTFVTATNNEDGVALVLERI